MRTKEAIKEHASKAYTQFSINARARAKVTEHGRLCFGCNEEKPWDQFHKQPGGTNGRKSRCVVCMRKHLDRWRAENPSHFRRIGWKYELKRLYKMTPEQYLSMLESQGNVCAICKEEGNLTVDGSELIKNGKPTKFHVDHDHVTGVVRGILCNSCNRGLGAFRDNVQYLQDAVKYLSK